MLGLGLGKNPSYITGSSVFDGSVDEVLFERNGNWSESDISGARISNCTATLGTSEVAGISNYVILTATTTSGGDPQFAYGSNQYSSFFSRNPTEYYNLGAVGDFKVTFKCYFPSSNTSTLPRIRSRIGIKSDPVTVSEDQWHTKTLDNGVEAYESIATDADMFEVEFDDTTLNEPVLNDVMYVTQFKVEYIAD